jgi:23S rRNA (cytosine1962-C5)-methyltransferase
MNFPKVILQKGRDEAVRRFHPWVFSGAVMGGARHTESLQDGDTVEVFDSRGTYLGTGHFHDGSIQVRLFSFAAHTGGQPIMPDVAFWAEKLRSIRTVRASVVPSNTNCYRLVHGEGDGCSGLIIDIYDRVAVLQAHSIGMHRMRQVIIEALQRVFGGELVAVYDKSVESLPDNYAAGVQNGFRFGRTDDGTPLRPRPVLENGHTFLVDWVTGQKTGFFLDQRDNRQLLARYAVGKRVLNCFCYSGGFSVYALGAGAAVVHSVDISQKAIDLTNQNVAVNAEASPGFSGQHEAIAADVMQYLKAHSQQYDVVVLDPPAYAKSLSAKHRAVQGYKRLNAEGLRRVAPGGILFTFSCSQVVDRELFYNTVVAAAIEAGRQVRVLHHLSQPADHPVSLFHPEGGYLKGLVLWVE